MKKFFSFLLLFFATCTYAKTSYAEHALMVHRLSYWAPDYLTVTNNWNNMFFSNAPSTLKSLSVITEIDGQSTKDMEPEDFYTLIDKETSFTISYMSKIRGENRTYTQHLEKKQGHLLCFDISEESWAFSYDSDEKWYFEHKDEEVVITEEWNPWAQVFETKRKTQRVGQTPKESTTLMSDQNTDFFQYCTFDYMVSGDDYMIDLGLAQALAKELEKKGLKYNPEAPDIYLYLTKDANAKIESIYSPNIISTTHTSSNTVGRIHFYYGNYNTWGEGRSSTTGTSSTNTYDAGQTKTVVDADLYLQVSILDAHRMDKANPPVVWQLVHNKHFKNEINILEWVKRLHCAVYNYPLSTQTIGRKIVSFGLFFQGPLARTGVICDVANGGWADKIGVKPGDVLKKLFEKYRKGNWMKTNKFFPGKGVECADWWLRDVQIIEFDKLKKEMNYDDRQEFKIPYFFIPESELE